MISNGMYGNTMNMSMMGNTMQYPMANVNLNLVANAIANPMASSMVFPQQIYNSQMY